MLSYPTLWPTCEKNSMKLLGAKNCGRTSHNVIFPHIFHRVDGENILYCEVLIVDLDAQNIRPLKLIIFEK